MGKRPAGSSAGGVVLSAHSGGGFEATRAAKGKKLAGTFAFREHPRGPGHREKLLEGKLDDDLHEIESLAPKASAAAAGEAAFQAQAQYLREKGFRFVGFAGSAGYKGRFQELRGDIYGDKG